MTKKGQMTKEKRMTKRANDKWKQKEQITTNEKSANQKDEKQLLGQMTKTVDKKSESIILIFLSFALLIYA